MRNVIATLFTIIFSVSNFLAQDTLSVLFIGNSYTSANNLPLLVQSLSSSAGKTLNIDSNMPGGYLLSGHLNDATTFSKISQGNWDYVILQEQSQIPTIDFYRYNDMYPAMTELKALIEQYNPCARVITYMTWGRRFGGQQCDPNGSNCSPVFSDFNHMQDSLTSAYTEISSLLKVQCAPVGVTWQNILNDTTLVLHSGDNSHPNIDGSYVAALSLYSSIWKLPAMGLSYNAGISAERATYYQSQSDITLFGLPNQWDLYINTPTANFNFQNVGNAVNFTNLSVSNVNNTLNYQWNFGDGTTSNDQNPTHTYSFDGTYTVTLIATDCIFSDTISMQVNALAALEDHTESSFLVYPNPTANVITVTQESNYIGASYTLMNNIGNKVLEGQLNTSKTSIDLSMLAKGIYFLSLGDKNNEAIKVVIE